MSGQTTTSETPVRPFAHATVGDANVGATDILTITLGGAGGTLADGTGFNSLTTVGAAVYTLSGTAAAITSELDALIFTPTAGAPNTSSTTTFTLSDQSSAGGAPVVDTTTTVIDNEPSLAAVGNANGAEIPVADPHFDMFPAGQTAASWLTIPGGGTGCAFADNTTVGWEQSATRSASADAGQYQTGVPQYTAAFNSDPMIDATTPEPIVARAANASFWQTISTPIVAGATYTLDVDLGFEKSDYDEASVYLIVDGHQVLATPLASYGLTQTQMQKTGNWYDFEASYTATSADPNGSIEILLSSLTNGKGFGFFGDVRLAWVAPPPPVVHPNNLQGVVHPNDLALSGSVTGAHNFIDTLNFVASYGDLINAFGTNQQAAQNWYNTQEPIEQRVETFDGLDYVASYGDLINAFKSAGSEQAVLDAGAAHFINDGSHEGRTTIFNGLDYIASYGDLINAFGANGDAGAYHYIESGASEGRTTTFDGLDYIASYSDLINAFGANEQAGAEHFIDNGYKEGRTTTFNGLDYIASYGDLIQAFGANNDAGATHYIDNGHNEGRTTTFDGLDYIASYGDLINALGANEQAGAEHFIDNGFKEGRTTTFDGLDYIANYTDLMKAFGANNDEGAAHYITNGHSEGRSTNFNVAAYESAHPDLIGKFSSNDAFLTAYIDTYQATGKFLT